MASVCQKQQYLHRVASLIVASGLGCLGQVARERDLRLNGTPVDRVVFALECPLATDGTTRLEALCLTDTIITDRAEIAELLSSLKAMTKTKQMPPAIGVLSHQVFLDRNGVVVAVVQVVAYRASVGTQAAGRQESNIVYGLGPVQYGVSEGYCRRVLGIPGTGAVCTYLIICKPFAHHLRHVLRMCNTVFGPVF